MKTPKTKPPNTASAECYYTASVLLLSLLEVPH